MNYAFIGLGNMASAIIKGMAHSNQFSTDKIYGYDIMDEKAQTLTEFGLIACDSIEKAVGADVVVLAVKPQVLPQVLTVLKNSIFKQPLIISIAAGKEIEYFERQLGELPIVRVMPNINAAVGAATSAYTGNKFATSEHKQLVERLFATVGTITELPEHLFGVFGAVAGASPAFAYMYIDALARVAVAGGMSKQQALDIAASTVFGSAKMILASSEHPWSLIDKVCSPGGTTIEGILSLQSDGFEDAVHRAIAAVIEKDKKLRQ